MTEGEVVVTYRRVETLLDTLAAVLDQSHPPDVVVVVDNDADRRVEREVALMGSNGATWESTAVSREGAPDRVSCAITYQFGGR